MLDRLLKLFISVIFFLLKKHLPGSLVVLTYHSVKPEQRIKFEKQMDMLISEAVPVRADVGEPLEGGQNYVAVTFDDGFQSVLENAIPIMSKRGIPATMFIPSGYLGKNPGWIKNKTDEILLTPDQLREMNSNQIIIGSHCVTHPRLSELDEDDARKELIESKMALQNILKKEITQLSFPYGNYNRNTLKLAKEAGYKRVFLNVPISPSSKDSYMIGRINVSPEDWGIEYRLKLLGAYQWLPFAITLKWKLIKFLRSFLSHIRMENG